MITARRSLHRLTTILRTLFPFTQLLPHILTIQQQGRSTPYPSCQPSSSNRRQPQKGPRSSQSFPACSYGIWTNDIYYCAQEQCRVQREWKESWRRQCGYLEADQGSRWRPTLIWPFCCIAPSFLLWFTCVIIGCFSVSRLAFLHDLAVEITFIKIKLHGWRLAG
jgi:hypothetical protein